MNTKKAFVVGSGKLANAILKSDFSIPTVELLPWQSSGTTTSPSIVIHAGSGRELKDCLEFCARTGSVLIELSTGLETEKLETTFPLIICPNTSILLLKTLFMLQQFGHNFRDYEISIMESHQSSKTTEPGTAYHIANSLHVPHERVISIRDAKTQAYKINIPVAHLEKHAYHQIVIKDQNDEIKIETKVLGHDSYSSGVKKIIEACIKNKLANKRHTVLDLVDMGLL
ncbi:dihydrodipicolinate reductase C-terminal domain-containing protein [Sphingobacterium sp. UBA5670]|uniref:dihydrodipicolinate reductase C-terminal domain-containing protein n=1 Tax=Sphingobacterium sp. UBA5670 TaxID=1947502 RepID=UPI0025E65784|nr:dihydrodipicolinate reductase C-terminal domain-containing protein [Sphingobacterium sp. UBA5670]